MTRGNWLRSVAAAALLSPIIALGQYTVEVLHSAAVPSPRSFGWGAGGGQQVGHTNIFLGGPSNALLWNGSANSFVNLHPAGFDASYAMDADGGRQVGWTEVNSPVGRVSATMWSGTAASMVNLHNREYAHTRALGIGGNQQVGMGIRPNTSGPYEALLWHGTAASVVNLHPKGSYNRSQADDTDGKQQVGLVVEDAQFRVRAALWSGTAESFVDLHPDGYGGSEALGVADGQQVGSASFQGNGHALLWFGSPQNFVDLNPGPNNEWGSEAEDTNGQHQVGLVRAVATGFQFHAARWSGTPESFLDLHTLLPSQFLGTGAESRAMGIDEFGNIVGWAADLDDGGRAKAVLWRPIPEPSGAVALGLLVSLFAVRMQYLSKRKSQ